MQRADSSLTLISKVTARRKTVLKVRSQITRGSKGLHVNLHSTKGNWRFERRVKVEESFEESSRQGVRKNRISIHMLVECWRNDKVLHLQVKLKKLKICLSPDKYRSGVSKQETKKLVLFVKNIW